MFKKFSLSSVLIFVFVAFALSLYISNAFAQISFESEFGDKRFEPADMYHAECLSTLQLGFDMKQLDNIKEMHLILDYDENALQIIQLRGEYQGTYTVAYDKLVLDFKIDGDDDLNHSLNNNIFAHLQFKSKENISSGQIFVNKDSYYITKKGEKVFLEGEYDFQLAEVPECEPDIISPMITLVYPENNSVGQSLDSYFVFELKDGEKGINKNSVSLKLNDILYEIDNSDYKNMFKRSGSYLLFFPDNWLPVNEKIDLEVRVADLQEYGGPNWVEEKFSIHTATGVLLNSEINPNMMRLFKQKTQQLVASSSECASLNQLYAESDIYNKYKLKSIMDKLACDINPDAFIISEEDDVDISGVILDADINPNTNLNSTTKSGLINSKGFSVFAVLGRLLFLLTLFLKFHYIHASYKYKKHYKKYKKNNNTSGVDF